ncbi:MAG: excinuclease ABC subunit UvrA, partial [Bacteroidales bacterium]|nr:excinuclease ABC subunit UvrA [Bacteroidales bacterium]
PKCNGLGRVSEIDINKIIPDKSKSIKKGAIEPLGTYKNALIFWQIEAIAKKYNFSLDTPVSDLPEDGLKTILHGSQEPLKLENTPLGASSNYFLSFEGVVTYISNLHQNSENGGGRKNFAEQFIRYIQCPDCKGYRLKKESLHFKVHDKHIGELASMDIAELADWLENVEVHLSEKQKKIGSEVLKELRTRVQFLLDVGLNYLALNLPSRSLSGGESQRIRLATQIGSQLVNVLYILDEPSIGLHQRDNVRLINALKSLRDAGNSIIVVEHDKEMMMSSDYIIDLGPKAGRYGGEIVFSGTPKQITECKSLTAEYLRDEKQIEVPECRRPGNGNKIVLKGATGNNLKNVDMEIPLGMFICVTGVSGSGKSSAINETLYPILSRHFYRSNKQPLPYKSIEGLKYIDKVIDVNQAPLGRTPRSNPATYTGVFSDIRSLFTQTTEAKIRGYKPGRFSFNVKGGRCETCQGAGVETIEMNFLPDVYVECRDCNGKRYNKETLQVKYKGKSISDVLEMTINQAVEFFDNVPNIVKKIKTIQKVGLGYIKLGQPSTTLSGGESQRIKLAAELSKRDTGKTLYILDEPTTGLHFEDIRVLLNVLNKLVNKGNTVIVIEHNMDVIKVADHIIDMGKEGGKGGGEILCTGTPEDIIKNKESFTAVHLKPEIQA